jgi:hypothetical protein
MLGKTIAPVLVAGLVSTLGLLGACMSGSRSGVSPATPPAPTPPTARATTPPASPATTPPAVPSPTPPPDTDTEPPGSAPEPPEAGRGEAGEIADRESEDGQKGDLYKGESETDAATETDDGNSGRPGRARTAEERSEALEGELQESLSEFDRKMLDEQETLERQRTSASTAGGADRESEAGSTGGAGGPDEGSDGATGDEDGTSQPVRGRTDGGGTGAREPGEPVADESNDAATRGRTPPDIPDGRDDDIVARQLREAAMEEDDPRLRERLWDEYRRYKGLPVKGDREDGTEAPGTEPGSDAGEGKEGGGK